MKHTNFFLAICLFFSISLTAQNIISGPVVGAVQPQSATIMVQVQATPDLQVKLLPQHDYKVVLEPRSHGFIALQLSNLKPYTRYEYELKVGTENRKGYFRTFPEAGKKGSYTVIAGSCQEDQKGKVFEHIPNHDPMFFMHTGDYTYPHVRLGKDFTANYDKVAQSYTMRYNENRMDTMLLHVPIDYVFDDHDHVNNGSGRFHSTDFEFSRKGFLRTKNELRTQRNPYEWHANAVKGYTEFFPHYEMPDTSEAIYHSFKMGNAEFFVLDRSSARREGLEVVFEKNKRGKYRFRPKSEQELFGKQQIDWLKAGLKNSTADWKFIVSGVPLNRKLEKVIKAGVRLQNVSTKRFSGFRMASNFSNYWAAYPHEMNDFYAFLENENIENIIVISGDTHHNVMDDGKNAGLPELNASGLSVGNTVTSKYMRWVGMTTLQFRYKNGIWNKGGNGLGNRNYKNGFGKIRIEGDEYVELSVIDEDNETVSSFRVIHTSRREK